MLLTFLVELLGGLSEPAEGAGQDSISRATRKMILEQMEMLGASVLKKFWAEFIDSGIQAAGLGTHSIPV